MSDLNTVELGSKTAKSGFQNEHDVVNRFNNWKTDSLAKEWLVAMDYCLDEVEHVKAVKVKGSFKSDIQVQIQITIKLKQELDCQNLQVKLVSNPKGFNQIDKRWIKSYEDMWPIGRYVAELLRKFTGEVAPSIKNPRDKRRMFMDEFDQQSRLLILDFFRKNKTLVITDILKGRGKFSAEWMLVILKISGSDIKWALEPNFFDGDVEMTSRGSIKIGKITVQRKGGDGGRDTANMLQFKINPALLIEEQTIEV